MNKNIITLDWLQNRTGVHSLERIQISSDNRNTRTKPADFPPQDSGELDGIYGRSKSQKGQAG